MHDAECAAWDSDAAGPWDIVASDAIARQRDAEQRADVHAAEAARLRELSAAYLRVISWARTAASAAEAQAERKGDTDGD